MENTSYLHPPCLKADVDGDGDLDLFMGHSSATDYGNGDSECDELLFNDGDGNFHGGDLPCEEKDIDVTLAAAFGDFDGVCTNSNEWG